MTNLLIKKKTTQIDMVKKVALNFIELSKYYNRFSVNVWVIIPTKFHLDACKKHSPYPKRDKRGTFA